MPLTELFIALLKENELNEVLSKIEDEVERRYGVISDEDKIEEVFFAPDQKGVMVGTNVYEDCMRLSAFLNGLNVPACPLTELMEEISGWNDGYAVEKMEACLEREELKRVEILIDKINEIPSKKTLMLYEKRTDVYNADSACKVGGCFASCDLSDYKNGRVTFADMRVRRLLLENRSDTMVVMVLTETPAGSFCIEVTMAEAGKNV